MLVMDGRFLSPGRDGRFLSPGRAIISDPRFSSPGRLVPMPNANVSFAYPDARPISTFSPVFPQVSLSPVIFRGPSPTPSSNCEVLMPRQIISTPHLLNQNASYSQEPRFVRYSSPIPGTAGNGPFLSNASPTVSCRTHVTSPLHSMHLAQVNLRQSRGASPQASLPVAVHTSSYHLANNVSAQNFNDPTSSFTAYMQQRQGERQSRAAEWRRSEETKSQGSSKLIVESRMNYPGHNFQFDGAQRIEAWPVATNFTVTIVSARNLPMVRGICNPYACVTYGGQICKSPVYFESVNPIWNHPSVMTLREGESDFRIAVFNRDNLGNEELIGSANFSTHQLLGGLSERSFVLKHSDGTAILGSDGCPAYVDVSVEVDTGKEKRRSLQADRPGSSGTGKPPNGANRKTPSPSCRANLQVSEIGTSEDRKNRVDPGPRPHDWPAGPPPAAIKLQPEPMHGSVGTRPTDGSSIVQEASTRIGSFGSLREFENREFGSGVPSYPSRRSPEDGKASQPVGPAPETMQPNAWLRQGHGPGAQAWSLPGDQLRASAGNLHLERSNVTAHTSFLRTSGGRAGPLPSNLGLPRSSLGSTSEGHSMAAQNRDQSPKPIPTAVGYSRPAPFDAGDAMSLQEGGFSRATNFAPPAPDLLPHHSQRLGEEHLVSGWLAQAAAHSSHIHPDNAKPGPSEAWRYGGSRPVAGSPEPTILQSRDRLEAEAARAHIYLSQDLAALRLNKACDWRHDSDAWDVPSLYATKIASTDSEPQNDLDCKNSSGQVSRMLSRLSDGADILGYGARVDKDLRERSRLHSSPDRCDSRFPPIDRSMPNTCRGQAVQDEDAYSVGIRLTRGPPYSIVAVQSLMDENCVLQGMHGFKYQAVAVGLRLVAVNGIPADGMRPGDVDRQLKGPMLSVCDLMVEDVATCSQWRVMAMRHILQSGSCIVGERNVAQL